MRERSWPASRLRRAIACQTPVAEQGEEVYYLDCLLRRFRRDSQERKEWRLRDDDLASSSGRRPAAKRARCSVNCGSDRI